MSEPGSLIRALNGHTAPRNSHARVTHDLGLGIVTGAYPPDQPLPNEAAIMDRCRVSRTVLREALKTLEAKGLVEARARVGTRVLPRPRWNLTDRQVLGWIFAGGPDDAFLRHLFAVRRTLELQAAILAVRHRTDGQIGMLHHWMQQRTFCANQPEPCALAEFELHRTMFEASLNPFLLALTGVTEFAIAAAFARRMRAGAADFAETTAPLFREMVAGMEAGSESRVCTPLSAIMAADARFAGIG